MFQINRNTWDERLDNFYPQGSSQWDGFRHVRCRELGYYGGVTDDPGPGNSRLSIHHWAREGVVGRGVLLDVAASNGPDFDAFAESTINADDLANPEKRNSATKRTALGRLGG